MNKGRPDYLSSERYGSDKKFYHFLHLALTDSLEKTILVSSAERQDR